MLGKCRQVWSNNNNTVTVASIKMFPSIPTTAGKLSNLVKWSKYDQTESHIVC